MRNLSSASHDVQRSRSGTRQKSCERPLQIGSPDVLKGQRISQFDPERTLELNSAAYRSWRIWSNVAVMIPLASTAGGSSIELSGGGHDFIHDGAYVFRCRPVIHE